jgi:lincosamide nucleotidyltransferase A/C/D/E
MRAEDALGIIRHLEGIGIEVWLDGGWAVDAALGTQTRLHDDLDLIVELRDVEELRRALESRGYAVARGAAPRSFELTDARGRQIDVHPVVFSESRDGIYVLDDGQDWIYPAAGFEGDGFVLDQRVRCLTPEIQMLCHTGYEPHLASFDDVAALSQRFGLAVPGGYRRPRESYRLRTDS